MLMNNLDPDVAERPEELIPVNALGSNQRDTDHDRHGRRGQRTRTRRESSLVIRSLCRIGQRGMNFED